MVPVAMTRESRRRLTSSLPQVYGGISVAVMVCSLLLIAAFTNYSISELACLRMGLLSECFDSHPPVRSLDLGACVHASLRHRDLHRPSGVRSESEC